MKALLRPALALSLLLPQAAMAHVGGHGEGAAFTSGLLHPVGGTDHLLAMVAVGIWAAALGGTSRLALPTAFVGAMIAGAGLGLAGVALPLVEPMILASSILIGLALALAFKPAAGVALGATALFGLMHGYAHGAEAPAEGILAYGLGFVLATALLHAGGVFLGRLALNRLLGAATAMAGVALALS